LTFTVNYAAAVTVDETNGKPSLPLIIGTASRQAAYSDGSGTTALTFSYTVQSGDLDGDGIVLGTDIVLNGGDMGLASTVLKNIGNTTGILVDGIAPAAPSVPDLSPASDSGSSNTDNLTSNTTPTVTGTAEAGSTVTLYDTDGTTVLGTAVATGGNWSITSSTLSEGTHSLTAKATDAAGNVGPASSALTLTIDVTAPAAPTELTATFGNQQNVLNWTANGGDVASYKVYGGTSATPTTVLATVTAPATTYTHTGLTNGTTYYYRITAVDQAGNEGTVSTEVNAVPKAPQVITFGALPVKTYGDADFAPGATSTNSTIAITYTSSNTAVAQIVDGDIHIVGAGTTTITALQAGNTSFTAAADVPQTLTVNRKALTITAKDRSKTYGTALTLGTTEFTASGLVNSDMVTSVTLTSAGAAATA
ncbi:fibronectin type III domain-containing protein, partial [Sphingobacterium sp. SGG-5]|uniref:Ig-like domain-containing protein n=1 Tax=Sphingobacterium sp. SGG-5 TaxID=2710881 RepID=UPI0013E9F7EB